jgi:hypothetical protein
MQYTHERGLEAIITHVYLYVLASSSISILQSLRRLGVRILASFFYYLYRLASLFAHTVITRDLEDWIKDGEISNPFPTSINLILCRSYQ